MGVLINKKRCDNAEVCPCIEGCPQKAFYYDKQKESVAVHNELCINCRKCMITCEAGAVKVYRNDEECAKIKTEYDEDIMTIEALFQDRYGATSIDEKYKIGLDSLDKLIEDSNKPLLIEFYDEDEASCLINSIPIEEIIGAVNGPLSYRKIEIADLNSIKRFEICELPALLIVENGEIKFKHEGAVRVEDKDALLREIRTYKY